LGQAEGIRIEAVIISCDPWRFNAMKKVPKERAGESTYQ
jgi:hypothetical protein